MAEGSDPKLEGLMAWGFEEPRGASWAPQLKGVGVVVLLRHEESGVELDGFSGMVGLARFRMKAVERAPDQDQITRIRGRDETRCYQF